MLQLLLRRLLWAVPTLFAVIVVAFCLSLYVPGDPVSAFLGQPSDADPALQTDAAARMREYERAAHQLYLDLPAFYGSVHIAALPDTLHRILPLSQRSWLCALSQKTGCWEAVSAWHKIWLAAAEQTATLEGDSLIMVKDILAQLSRNDSPEALLSISKQLPNAFEAKSALVQAANDLQSKRVVSLIMPRFVWYGAENRFHKWISNWLVGDFGISFRDGRKVTSKIREALPVTLSFSIPSFLFMFFGALPLGLWMAQYARKKRVVFVQGFLYFLSTLPVFIAAIWLLALFTVPDYGMDFLPSGGLGRESSSAWVTLWDRVQHLILPIFCLSYGGFAYFSLLLRDNLRQNEKADYIRTARAKGLSEKQVFRKHILRNSLLPLITMLGQHLPALIAGSVLVEVIFNLPGMGQLSYISIQNRDWPMVFGMVWIFGVVAVLGLIVADLLSAWANPKLRKV